MEGYTLIIFLLLTSSVLLTSLRSKKYALKAKFFRILVILISLFYFGYWFAAEHLNGISKNAMAVQVISKLPQSLDFYIVKIEKTNNQDAKNYDLKHLGNIRPEHYRLEYLDMKNSDEYWVIGYLGKKNFVYFTQHSVLNKNMDQIVEVNNYINQSQKLSKIADSIVTEQRSNDIQNSVWVTLGILFLFINIVLLFTKKKDRKDKQF